MNEQEEFEFRARAEKEGIQTQSQQQPKQGIIRRGWDALKIPEQKSKQGLEMIAQMIPEGKITGNRTMDILRGTPRIAANTLAQAAPGFISRGSMMPWVAGPALKMVTPALKAMGSGIGSQLESLSGMKPGLLKEAFNDPTLIAATIPKAAKEAYQAENAGLEASKLVTENPRPMGMIMKAMRMAKEGTLTPGEALAARKNIDKVWKSGGISDDWKNIARKTLDAVVKKKEDLASADKAFSRGKKAAGLRQILPQNKYGGASPFKMAMGGIAAHGGLPGKALASLMSPMASGLGASTLGSINKIAGPIVKNREASISILQLLKQLRGQSSSTGSAE